jgi:hypothetical protein
MRKGDQDERSGTVAISITPSAMIVDANALRCRGQKFRDRAKMSLEGVARLLGQIEVPLRIRRVECPKDALLRDQEFGD